MTSKRRYIFPAIAIVALISTFLSPSFAANPNANCTAVDGDYIVSFSKGASVANEIKNIRGKRVTPTFNYSKVLNGFASFLTAEQACELLGQPNIESIELDGVVTITSNGSLHTQTSATWGLARIDQALRLPVNTNYNYIYTGSGVTAYIIDTGIQYNHPDFGGAASFGFDAFGGTGGDCHGHGTHVAGTIGGTMYGVAKDVSLVAVRVLNCQGSGTWSGVLAGIDWVANNHQDGVKAVANMSLGGGANIAVDNAINNLISNGVTVVVAAGNSGANACNYSPARATNAITVAASNKDDVFASWSNYGSCVDIIAPGANITSDWLVSRKNPTGVITLNGTSMASPHVAGTVAILLQIGTMTSGGTALPPANKVLAPITMTTTQSAGGTTPNLFIFTNP